MTEGPNGILKYLSEKRGFDFSGYRISMVERRIKQRFISTGCSNYTDYLNFLRKSPHELDKLLDVLTIKVSRFFRDSLTFEYVYHRILPSIVSRKKKIGDHSLRIWSCGCAKGEEPYSIAILIHDLMLKEDFTPTVNIFATDIDAETLKMAQKAAYPFESIQNIKYNFLKNYFTRAGETYQLLPVIRDMVSFSVYDILHKNSYAPPESVFGGFDMVLCRNVLIYFDPEYQCQIFHKLYRSLIQNGYLVLGKAEVPLRAYQRSFLRVNECCHVYRKK